MHFSGTATPLTFLRGVQLSRCLLYGSVWDFLWIPMAISTHFEYPYWPFLVQRSWLWRQYHRLSIDSEKKNTASRKIIYELPMAMARLSKHQTYSTRIQSGEVEAAENAHFRLSALCDQWGMPSPSNYLLYTIGSIKDCMLDGSLDIGHIHTICTQLNSPHLRSTIRTRDRGEQV